MSCPNVKKGGLEFSSDKKVFTDLLIRARKATDKILIVKLSPSAGSIIDYTMTAENKHIDAVTIANTYKSALIDINKKEIKIQGGLSGPAIFPVTLNTVLEVCKRTTIPVIASGGIYNSDTAIQYLLAGAKAVQIGTYNFVDPKISLKIIDGIKKYLTKNRISDINKVIGKVRGIRKP